VKLEVVRDGRPITIAARLDERGSDDEPAEGKAKPAASPTRKGDALGLVVATLQTAARVELKVPRDRLGVVIQEVLGADPGTDALEEGDLVVEVNRKATPDAASYRRVVGALAPGEAAWLTVFRPSQRTSFLTRVEVEKRP
jgi:S1-C subfamily serine protease